MSQYEAVKAGDRIERGEIRALTPSSRFLAAA
jgi:hypothetical protein